jgi:hypothetical protein
MNSIFIILLIIIIIMTLYHYKKFIEHFLINRSKECQIPVLRSDRCFETKKQLCPQYDGTYLQCSNNILPPYNVVNCNSRAVEVSVPSERLSEKCLYNNLNESIKYKRYYNDSNYYPNNPSIFPRVNLWRNDDLALDPNIMKN